MKQVKAMSAMKAIYFLMAIDGDVDGVEMERFKEIGMQFDGENFSRYETILVNSCRSWISGRMLNDEYYDVLQEGVDSALNAQVSENDARVTGRALVWNMLAVAVSNNEYHPLERRLIAHIARVMDVPRDVVMQMEFTLKTNDVVSRELEMFKNSDLSYRRIRPIVDELEHRLTVVYDAALNLISDEAILDEPYMGKHKETAAAVKEEK